MKKPETVFACQNCGHQSRKWLGKCPECGEWNSLVEERNRAAQKGSARNTFQTREVEAIAYSEIESQDEVRIASGVTEFDRVLGGGIVPGTRPPPSTRSNSVTPEEMRVSSCDSISE